jgi:hypothetical protein
MSTYYAPEYRAALLGRLQHAAAAIWSNDELDLHIDEAARELERVIPQWKESILSAIDERSEVDISSLTDCICIDRVEAPCGSDPPTYHNFTLDGNYLKYRGSKADVNQKTETGGSTLTGTLTFTQNSTAVTGASSLFTTEINEDDGYIKKSSGTAWYKVKSVTSATALVLERPFLETTGADTATSSLYRKGSEVVRIYWGTKHAITETATTIPSVFEPTIVCGAFYFALNGYMSKVRSGITSALAEIALFNAAADSATARITQALADLASGRALVGKELTDINTALDAAETAIAAGLTSLTSGSAFYNTVNIGDGTAGSFLNQASIQVNAGLARIQRAAGLLAEDQQVGEYGQVAAGELNSAMGFVRQGRAYSETASGYMSTSRLAAMMQPTIDRAYAEWQRELWAAKRNPMYKKTIPQNYSR